MPRNITSNTTLDNLKREAKRWLRALRANAPDARARLERALASAPATPALRDVQHALALEYGLSGWTALKQRLAAGPLMRRYEQVAEALVIAYRTGDESAMRIVWDYFGHGRTWDVMRRYVRLDLGRSEQAGPAEADAITLDEARFLVARAQDFESWTELEAFAASVPPGQTLAAKAAGAFTVNEAGSKQVALRSRDWDALFAAIQERRLTGLHAAGQMTDALLERVSRLDCLTALDLEGSKALSDEGVLTLERLPRLRHLNLMGCGITDRGLDVLRRLPALESIVLAWTPVTDAGAANLAACEQLQRVDLSATPTGDAAIRALAGKRRLSELRSGNAVTDAGLALLHELPVFKRWPEDAASGVESIRFGALPNVLSLRGSFTDAGLARLAGLDGLAALDVDGPHLAITGAGFAPLASLPRLAWLACDATDESMPFIAALPHLRFLMCQDTAAGDAGFAALSRSRSIEHIWGRRCYNLQRRGFTALADMPRLRYLSVSCKNVDDVGLSALPRFPALRELMPMDVTDAGYRHVGRCEQLESLVLMYCRETTDAATEQIVGLTQLKKYFASYNRVTDRTPILLAGMSSLEEIVFDSCAGLTNAGIAALARLPRLRHLRVSSMPKVTRDVAAAFPARVTVSHST